MVGGARLGPRIPNGCSSSPRGRAANEVASVRKPRTRTSPGPPQSFPGAGVLLMCGAHAAPVGTWHSAHTPRWRAFVTSGEDSALPLPVREWGPAGLAGLNQVRCGEMSSDPLENPNQYHAGKQSRL